MSADTSPPIYSLKNAFLTFGVHPLFKGLDIHIKKGDKICLIGRNGSGKSTLLKVIAGLLEPDEGERFIQPATKISYMAQETHFDTYQTLRDVVLSGLDDRGAETDEEYKADILISELGIHASQSPQVASGGELKKAALARALIGEPDILLLDEPTNHLDIATIEKLEQTLLNFEGAVVVISHDRRFLTTVSNATIWLDRGIAHEHDKGYAHFDAWQEQILEQEIIAQKNLNKKIEEETEWLHKGVTARRKRNMGRLRRLQQLRLERKEQILQVGSVNLEIDKGDIRSKMIIEAKHVSKSFQNREIIHDFSIRVLRGNKIGIVGPNGAGKTTLIKLMTKRLEPDTGSVRLAKNLEEAYFDQQRIQLNPQKTLWQTLCPDGDHIFVRGHYRHVVSYLKDFLFTPTQAQSPVGILSGGEKNRLMLALCLARPSNFLVLDEPTNDLDMDTLDLLQEVLAEYEGTILIISHDRDFLDKVATSLLHLRGDGSVIEYVGSYSDLLASEKKSAQRKRSKQIPKNRLPARSSEIKASTNKPHKLSFTEQHLFKNLPQEIDQLTQQATALETQLSDQDLCQRDFKTFQEIATRLGALRTEIEAKENKWLELAERAENESS